MHTIIQRGLAWLLFGLLMPTAVAAEQWTADFWQVPWQNTRPRDPAVAADGRVWFVGQTGDYVAVFDPASASFKRFDLEKGAGPHNLIVGEDGMIWYAGNQAQHIGRMDPATGTIEKLMTPTAVPDPHTLVGDGQGHIWFTAQRANHVGRVTLANRKVETWPVTTPRALPYGIVVDRQGRPWANLLGTHKLLTIDPKTLALEEILLPRESARTRRIEVSEDQAIWYVDYAGGFLGRMDPGTREVREWQTPSGEKSRPYAMALDHRGWLWVAESGPQPNRMVAFDPQRGEFVANVVLSEAGGAVRHMVFDGKTKALWFGTDTGYIGRLMVDAAAP